MQVFPDSPRLTRRQAIGIGLAAAASGTAAPALGAAPVAVAKRPIPRSGEKMPVIGLGTSQVFEHDGSDAASHAERRVVLETLLAHGANVIDTAPSYGSAETNVGALLAEMKARERFFVATKVGVKGSAAATLAEMEQSQRRLRTQKFDLMQLHNTRSADTDLGTLRDWKAAGKTRYIGVTNWRDSSHDVLVQVLERQKPDFLQINYSLDERSAEADILPIARDNGIAVLINVPFGGSRLFGSVRGKPLPGFALDIGATSWAQVFLKFILANDAVTCIIPGTSDPKHMADNLAAGMGPVPNAAQRKQIIDHWESLV